MDLEKLHIVSFNVPYPADYGGVVDVFYRIKTLHDLGVKVHLHTFLYGREPAPILEHYCEQVDYYQRDMSPVRFVSSSPFIVNSRFNQGLVEKLREDDYPILLEGLHCCSLLEHLKDRNILVRAHNVEHDYYQSLAMSESRFWKKIYLQSEARKLQHYEPILCSASAVMAVTDTDAQHFESIGCKNVHLMPSSHPYYEVQSQLGRGDYIMYHADLSVPDNQCALEHMIDTLFSRISIPVVVAGRNPEPRLREKISHFRHIQLIANPSDEKMDSLIANAHILVLTTNQPTGLKLKLLSSLYRGRFCVVNSNMVAGTDLGRLCVVADDSTQQLESIHSLMNKDFDDNCLAQRVSLLGNLYDNRTNAQRLMDCLDSL